MADRTNELYEIMDRCGLTASNLLTSKQNMNKTVSTIRLNLAKELGTLLQPQPVKEGDHE